MKHAAFTSPGPWPLLSTAADTVDPTAHVPVGIDPATGEPVTAPLAGAHWLLTGQPGAGKTVAARQLAAATRTRHTRLWLLDAHAEAGDRRDHPTVARYVTAYHDDLTGLLDDLTVEFERRRTLLAAPGTTALTPGVDTPLLVLYVEELLVFVREDRHAGRVAALLLDVLRDGSQLAVTLVATTQRADPGFLPAALTGGFTHVYALRHKTAGQSDYSLGAGHAEVGIDAANLPLRGPVPGLGYLGTPDRLVAQLVASHYISEANEEIPVVR